MTTVSRPVWSDAVVVETRPITDRIRRITLERPRGAGETGPRRAAPGTHVDVGVHTPQGADVRSYSVVESDDSGTRLSISVLRARSSRGGSEWMHGLALGDRVPCTQPLQNFELRTGAARYVLLAGGVGITALVAAARALRRLGQDYRFVYVGVSRDAMAYVEELVDEHGDRIEVHVDDEGTPLDVEAFVGSLSEGPVRTELYLCGPIRLMDAVRRAWLANGRPVADLRYETFGSSGWFDPEPFEVSIPELGITTTVRAESSLLEALAEAGADLMWDCRKGECGLCEVRVGALEGRVDHRDVFLSDQQKDTNDSLCLCVSRVVSPADAPAGSGRLSLLL